MSKKPRVLVIDDEPELRQAIREELEPDFVVLTAAGYGGALFIVHHVPGLVAVISDYQLGSTGTGLDILNAARVTQPACGRILISACRDQRAIDSWLANGAVQRFIPKPFAAAALVRALREVIDEAASRTALSGPSRAAPDP